jgi:uncharacterized membrane protein YkvA (DUF1232 family)
MMTNRLAGWWDEGRARYRAEDYVGNDAAANERAVRDGFAAKARRFLRHLPMAREVVAMYFCMLDARTPFWVKATVAGALAYFVLPTDAIPDFLPVVGMGDDMGILAATFTAVSSHINDDHRARATSWIQDEQINPAAS